jgi:Fe-S cluster biogenesis protein NfuA
MNNDQFQSYTKKVDQLVERVTALPDSEARTTALELLQSVMDLHGACISRIVEVLLAGGTGHASLAKLAEDPLICGLLVLYGVHPVPLEDRVKHALERIRPQLHKLGGSVAFLAVGDGTVRLKIENQTQGFSSEKLKTAIEQVILETAPEITEIVFEGLMSPNFIPVGMIQPVSKEETNYEESAA